MIRKLLLVVFFLPFALTAQDSTSKQFSIFAAITGIPENTEVSLSDVNVPTDTIAKARIINGTVQLKGSIQEPNLYNLNFHAPQKKK